MIGKVFKGKTALITGASSGIGESFARTLAQAGVHLVLVARRKDLLEALAKELRSQHDVSVIVDAKDISDQTGCRSLISTYPHIDILINNAGFGMFGEFLSMDFPKVQNMLDLNIRALTELTYEFGKAMKERGHGYILNVASIGAFQATPLYAAYCATKSYVLHFGEALHEELKPHGVTVCVLSPGVTQTEFFDVAGQRSTFFQRLTMQTSDQVAKEGLCALAKGRASVVSGLHNKIVIFLNRLTPRFLQRTLAHQFMKND